MIDAFRFENVRQISAHKKHSCLKEVHAFSPSESRLCLAKDILAVTSEPKPLHFITRK